MRAPRDTAQPAGSADGGAAPRRADKAGPGGLSLRDAVAGDATAIAAIWNPIIRDTVVTFWPTPRRASEIATLIARRQAAGWAFLVAETTETASGLAGFGSVFQFRGGPGYARTMEHTVYVAPAVQGRGIGAALLRALEARAAAAGARALIGAVTGSNAASLAFHRRHGYAPVGRIPEAGWKFGRFHDLVLMHKRIGVVPAEPS